MLRGPAYSRPFPYRGENEQGFRRSGAGESRPMASEGSGALAEEVALAPAHTGRESEVRAAIPPARSPPLQPEDRPRLSSQGSLPATLITTRPSGRQVLR